MGDLQTIPLLCHPVGPGMATEPSGHLLFSTHLPLAKRGQTEEKQVAWLATTFNSYKL